MRRLREQQGWTQEEAAHRCSMTTRLYQRVEGEEANVTFTSLARLCAGFDVDVVRLFKPAKEEKLQKQN
ncbi:helix-turn-helix transcriptional regulator [Myxococcus xanthus]|uniref:Helix-turn-helix transcriptional regulator n=1 Tax=Myxococcus xanthus TaxID=34 RepID=A0A7Y4MTN4_MYXXA|nr:helix-turn-helix transcriptional regulator [Myxococcus xanthus]NOJ89832.1 helix-turn-helix transcriptional regulator [Myxococcus xanthus]